MATLQVSNRTVNLDGRIYNLRTVSSVSQGHGRTKRPYRIRTVFYSFVVTLICTFAASQDSLRDIGLIGTALSGLFLLFVVFKNMQSRDFWVLQMEVAGHYSRLVASRDRSAIERAITQICNAMEADAPFQSTVTISGNTIIRDSELEGVTINSSGSR